MDAAVIVALITVPGSIIGAALSFYLTKRHERMMEWQREKINHYKAFLSAITDVSNNKFDESALQKLANASNELAIIAPQEVIMTWMNLFDEISSPNFTKDRQDELMKKLVLSIRRDINLPNKDDPLSFSFELIAGGSSKPKSVKST
jgi:hypothetical protein